jgi:DNA-directed RNA polymerase subunit omega
MLSPLFRHPSDPKWPVSPSKIACTTSRTCFSSCWSRRVRARKLANGAEATLEWENDKPTVLALREVAAGHVGLEILEEPDRPPQELMPEPEFMGELRAPQIGLGD